MWHRYLCNLAVPGTLIQCSYDSYNRWVYQLSTWFSPCSSRTKSTAAYFSLLSTTAALSFFKSMKKPIKLCNFSDLTVHIIFFHDLKGDFLTSQVFSMAEKLFYKYPLFIWQIFQNICKSYVFLKICTLIRYYIPALPAFYTTSKPTNTPSCQKVAQSASLHFLQFTLLPKVHVHAHAHT